MYILMISRFVTHSFTIHHHSLKTEELVGYTARMIQSIESLRDIYTVMQHAESESARRTDSARFYERIRTVDRMTAGNALQHRLVDTLKMLVADQLLPDRSVPGAVFVAASQPQTRVRAVLDSLVAIQDGLLARQLSEDRKMADNTLFMALVGGSLGVIFLALFLYRLYRDMQLRKKAEAELKGSETKYRRLIEDSGVVMFTTDTEGRFTFVSNRVLAMTGYTTEELTGKHFSVLVAPEHLEKVSGHYQHQLKTRTPETVLEFLVKTKTGENKWVEQTAVLLFGENQWMKGLQCIVKDIDEKKRYQLELSASESGRKENQYRLESIMNYSTSLIFIKDMEGRYLLVNKRFQSMFQATSEELVGKTDYDLEPRDVAARYEKTDQWVLTNKEAKEAEETILAEDGPHHYMIIKFPLFDHEGQIFGLCGIATDISDRIHYEQQLIEARRIAEEAERSQERFLANVSHEIRTPLSAIIGMTNLLTASPLNPEQRDFAWGISESANTLLVLINDILDFSKIKAGKLTIEHITFDLANRLEKILYPLRHKAGEKQLTCSLSLDPGIPATVKGDPHRLSQVLINLISNAIKFTDTGGVSLEVRVQRTEGERVWIDFTVSDTGIGIRDDQLTSIFESFTQSGPEITRRYGGTGLGLTITRELVELQGGTVRVESELGKGSRFKVCLPFFYSTGEEVSGEDSSDTSDKPVLPEGLKGVRLLVAEDNPVNQKVFRYTLKKADVEADIVNNGKELIAALESGVKYDLILSDIRMPELDGYQATKYIRQVLKLDIPILAMTASVHWDNDSPLDKGITGFISKPFTIAELYEKMTRYILAIGPEEIPEQDAPASGTSAPLYDLSLVREMDDPIYEREVIELFLDTAPPMVASLRQKIDTASWHEAYLQAHELKSSLGIFKMQTALELASRMEANAKANEHLDEMPGLLSQLQTIVLETQPLLQAELNKMDEVKS